MEAEGGEGEGDRESESGDATAKAHQQGDEGVGVLFLHTCKISVKGPDFCTLI